jgi:hypothetical protein
MDREGASEVIRWREKREQKRIDEREHQGASISNKPGG